jgi:hypothetical protein
VSKAKLRKLLAEFKTNRCPYENNGKSCWEIAKSVEMDNKQLGVALRSLMRHRSSWNKNDLGKVFDLAFTFGKAAKFHWAYTLGPFRSSHIRGTITSGLPVEFTSTKGQAR